MSEHSVYEMVGGEQRTSRLREEQRACRGLTWILLLSLTLLGLVLLLGTPKASAAGPDDSMQRVAAGQYEFRGPFKGGILRDIWDWLTGRPPVPEAPPPSSTRLVIAGSEG